VNVAIKIFKIFTTVSDHRSREGGQRFSGNLDWARSEKLVVWKHLAANVQRRTLNVQRRMQSSPAGDGGSYNSFVTTFDEADVAAAFDARDFYF